MAVGSVRRDVWERLGDAVRRFGFRMLKDKAKKLDARTGQVGRKFQFMKGAISQCSRVVFMRTR